MPEKEQTYSLISIRLKQYPKSSVREIVLPSDLSLERLDMVIGNIFGWNGMHLACFQLGKERNAPSAVDKTRGDTTGRYSFKDLSVQDAFRLSGGTFFYIYDYGAERKHTIKLKKENYQPEPGQYPIYCLKSQGPKAMEDGCSGDDDLMCETYGVEYEDLFDEDDGEPTDLYFELREKFSTPLDDINVGLAALCQVFKLKKLP